MQGELFNVETSTLKPEEWLNVSAIVELEVLGEGAKNFFVLLVCHYVLESLRADPKGGVDKNGKPMPVRHAIFIEEAHNVIAPSTQQEGTDSVDPKNISNSIYCKNARRSTCITGGNCYCGSVTNRFGE